jgi:lysyl-tRNA synthetase class 1
MQFVKKYMGENTSNDSVELMHKMINHAVAYYNDFVSKNRVPQRPDDLQMRALNELKNALLEKDEKASVDDLQNVVFSVGQKFFEGDIKRWFETIYGVLFGANNGPRIGSFISLYGINNTASLITKRVSNDGK